jgi:hypothetical protein
MKKYDAVEIITAEESVTVEGKPLQYYLKTLKERARYVRNELKALDLLRFARILVGIAFLGKELPPGDPLRPYNILKLIGIIMRPWDPSDYPSFL